MACPTPPRTEAENVEQPTTIVTHRRLEVNPKASAAWKRRLSGHAVLGRCPRDCRPFPCLAQCDVSSSITLSQLRRYPTQVLLLHTEQEHCSPTVCQRKTRRGQRKRRRQIEPPRIAFSVAAQSSENAQRIVCPTPPRTEATNVEQLFIVPAPTGSADVLPGHVGRCVSRVLVWS